MTRMTMDGHNKYQIRPIKWYTESSLPFSATHCLQDTDRVFCRPPASRIDGARSTSF